MARWRWRRAETIVIPLMLSSFCYVHGWISSHPVKFLARAPLTALTLENNQGTAPDASSSTPFNTTAAVTTTVSSGESSVDYSKSAGIAPPIAAASLGDIMSEQHNILIESADITSAADTQRPKASNGLVTTEFPLSFTGAVNHANCSTTSSVTTTRKRQTLASTFGVTHPLDRLALTANGNLQRLLSSYYDSPVTVDIQHCVQRQQSPPEQPGPATWDRVVHLQVFHQTFCTATSVIEVTDPLCRELVESGQVGLGQLFRYLDILPVFVLHNAGVRADGTLRWRDYTLQCEALSCRIHEEFRTGVWEMSPVRDMYSNGGNE